MVSIPQMSYMKLPCKSVRLNTLCTSTLSLSTDWPSPCGIFCECLLWWKVRVGMRLSWRERWMAYIIGWMDEHTIGETITWTPFVWGVDMNGKHKEWKAGRHTWWVLWLWSGSLWLINTIQTLIIMCFPKQHTYHTCVGFSTHEITKWKKGKDGCEWRDNQDSIWRVKMGVSWNEQEPHSSLYCLFVFLLVVHWLVLLIPLLSVDVASSKMGYIIVGMLVSVVWVTRELKQHKKQFQRGVMSVDNNFLFVISF